MTVSNMQTAHAVRPRLGWILGLTSTARLSSRWLLGRAPAIGHRVPSAELETAYCAEVLAVTYQDMGLLPGARRPNWYDAGRFWSGDHLGLSAGYRLGGEIAVHIPAGELAPPRARGATGGR